MTKGKMISFPDGKNYFQGANRPWSSHNREALTRQASVHPKVVLLLTVPMLSLLLSQSSMFLFACLFVNNSS